MSHRKHKNKTKDINVNVPIINLSSEGLLLECKLDFRANRLQAADRGRDNIKKPFPGTNPMPSYVQVSAGKALLFLGCRNYHLHDSSLGSRRSSTRVAQPLSSRLIAQDFRTPIVTSLRFLLSDTIVKIDWVGYSLLDQLMLASNFMYENLQPVNIVKRK